MKAPEMILGSFDRPNISYSVRYLRHGQDAVGEAAQIVLASVPESEQPTCTIIYALKRDTVDEVASRLRRQGMPSDGLLLLDRNSLIIAAAVTSSQFSAHYWCEACWSFCLQALNAGHTMLACQHLRESRCSKAGLQGPCQWWLPQLPLVSYAACIALQPCSILRCCVSAALAATC